MGHASMQTTLRYADYAPDPSGAAVWTQQASADPVGDPFWALGPRR